jgi:serine/threonine-protein kinase
MLVGQNIGPFLIEKELGSGAMGTVYRAVHLELKRRVALKIMAPGLTSETALKRFKREAEILKKLKHPNIVGLFGIGKHHKSPYYAMEYIEGESLDHVMERRGRISWEETVEIGKQLCAGLQNAHEHSIIHRDLKPSNVMVLPPREGQAYGTVKLTDFGIAKALDATEQYTATNCTVGTASYMSPEQCRGERDLTPKSDLYSLGIMLYELVTGKKPFLAESIMEMFQLHETGTAVRPARLVPELPLWMETLIMQLLEKKPDRRPFNAATVAEALERVKEKVEAQQSAGVEAATRRRIDRSGLHPELDETDKEAARTLVNKKKKRKKNVPFFRRGWFLGIALSAALVGIGYFFYWTFIKPPSPESLIEQAEQLRKSASRDARFIPALSKGPVADFLSYYPKHARAAEVTRWGQEIDRDELERILRSFRQKPRDQGEEWYARALDEEDAGKLDKADEYWSKLRGYKNPDDPFEHAYGLVAAKYSEQLDEVKRLEQEIHKKARKELNTKQAKTNAESKTKQDEDKKGDIRDDELAMKAMVAELGTNAAAAKNCWEQLKEQTRESPDRRQWYLLAVKRLRGLQSSAK